MNPCLSGRLLVGMLMLLTGWATGGETNRVSLLGSDSTTTAVLSSYRQGKPPDTTQRVAVAGQAFTNAIRVTLAAPASKPWDVMLRWPIQAAMDRGREYDLKFAIRTSGEGATTGSVGVVFQSRRPPNRKALSEVVSLGPDWRLIERRFRVVDDVDPTQAEFALHLAYAVQTVEIGGLELTGPVSSRPPPPPLPSPAEPGALLGSDLNQFLLANNTGDEGLGRSEIAAVADAPSGATFTNALRVAITKPMKVDQSWAVELKAPLVAAVTNGDVCFLEFWARCLESEHETGTGQITAFVQLGHEPWTKCLAKRINLGKVWTKVRQPFMATVNLASGEGQCGFHLAFAKQTVEIAGVRLIDYRTAKALRDLPLAPQVTYAGREPDATWRAEAARRIEAIRKADLTVRVVRADGSPVTGAVVRAAMVRHAFPFGTAAGYLLEKKDADGQAYASTLRRLFNTVVLDNTFKSGDWQNPQIRERGIRLAKRLKEEGFQQRGHLLMWGVFENTVSGLPATQQAALKADPVALRQYLRTFADDVLGTVGTDITDWDAINHLTAYWGTKIDTLAGGLDVYADFLKYLRTKYPALTLAVNESSYMDEYFRRIRYLVDHGAAPDAIGFMSHFSDTATPTPEELLANLDRFAVFGKPLRATEFDFGTNDEQLQADFTRDFLTVYFSHPRVDAIVFWGFWEKAHWRPETALFRADWTPKPAAKAYEDLVLRQWWTDITLRTDAAGQVKLRGYQGNYTVTVTEVDKTSTANVVLPKAGFEVTVRLNPEP